MALPPDSWCGIPLVPRVEAVMGMEGSDLPLRTYPWGARLLSFCLISRAYLSLLWNKEHLVNAFFWLLTHFHQIPESVQVVLGALGSERSKDSLCSPGPAAWRARHRAHKLPRWIRGVWLVTGSGTVLGVPVREYTTLYGLLTCQTHSYTPSWYTLSS